MSSAVTTTAAMPAGFGGAPRMRTARRSRRDRPDRLIPMADALCALGRMGTVRRWFGDVPVKQIVGTVARSGDFDSEFRLRNRELRPRWQRVAEVMSRGVEPPVELVQLGELYFVVDGHHRVSVARAMGREVVTARVQHICTVAYAMACLRLAHLASKAAERRFLERIPLTDDLRSNLWLERPGDWARLADAAEAWGFRQALDGRPCADREELAGRWWHGEVTPVLRRLRAAGAPADLRDVQLYTAAMLARDHEDGASWPPEPADAHRLAGVLAA